MLIDIDSIKINERLREVDHSKAEEIADSIKEIGLINPITLSEDHTLIAGLHSMIVLDIGCGKNKAPGSIGIDCHALPGVDIVHDANKPFHMFSDSSVDKIIMGHSLEHLHDIVPFMEEMYRILKPGGIMLIDVPHAGGLQAFTDPTHKSFFTMQTMDYFTPEANASYYSNARFEIVESRIVFMNHGILEYIFNMRPLYFEKWLRVVPLFSSIHWELRKV